MMRAGFIGALLSAGCATGVTISKETPNGGIIAYSFKDERGGPMFSPDRSPALGLMQATCPQGDRVSRKQRRGSAAMCRGCKKGWKTTHSVGGGASSSSDYAGTTQSCSMLQAAMS